MTREILVNVTPHEVRTALVEGGAVQEIHLERASRRGLVGNLYRGRVLRVLPGMQAAFIEVGLERTAFLHVADVACVGSDPAAAGRAQAPDDIATLLQAGQEILVQVTKDPLGSKGARLTMFVSLPSRFLVHMPYAEGIGVSSRIDDPAERERLRGLLQELTGAPGAPAGGGYIVRTAARGAPLEALRADMLFLARLWEHIGTRAQGGLTGLVHAELPLPLRVVRDELGGDVRRVLVDSEEEHRRMREFAEKFMPEAASRIEFHVGTRPLFDLHAVDEEIGRALERRVTLKSGGYIVIDQTESMTTIDVNTGAYVGFRNLEDTSFRTNLEAAVAIARQLRLRNLGGIIIIDFIDMQEVGHREQLLAAFEQALSPDRAQTQIAAVSALGLVEMTRKRTRESLEHLLCEPCPACQGRGSLRSVETMCHEIYREVLRQTRQFSVERVVVLAHPEVIQRMQEEEAAVLADLETRIARPIRLQAEAMYAIDQYDVVLA